MSSLFGLQAYLHPTEVRTCRDKRFALLGRSTAIPVPAKNYDGLLDVQVASGHVTVRPSHLIMGDDDGVLRVRREAARNVPEKAKVQSQTEVSSIKGSCAGLPTIDLYDLRGKCAGKSRQFALGDHRFR